MTAPEVAELRFTFRLGPSEKSALEALADEHDRTVGWEIRHAIRAYLKAEGMTTSDAGRRASAPAA